MLTKQADGFRFSNTNRRYLNGACRGFKMSLKATPVKSRFGAAHWLRLVAALAILCTSQLVFVGSGASAADTACNKAPSPPYVATKTVTTLTPADARTTNPLTISFGTSRASQRLAPYTFTVTGPLPDPAKMSWDLLLVNGNETLPAGDASVTFSDVLNDLRVTLCLTPGGVPAGSYSGSLTIAGPGVQPVELPLTINLKDNNLFLIVFGIVVAAAAAIFFKWWTMKIADPESGNTVNIKEFLTWIRNQWITVFVAVIGAAGGVFITKFLNADSFVPNDRWELWVTTFTAVMSASLLLNALGSAVASATGGQTKPSH